MAANTLHLDLALLGWNVKLVLWCRDQQPPVRADSSEFQRVLSTLRESARRITASSSTRPGHVLEQAAQLLQSGLLRQLMFALSEYCEPHMIYH